MSPAGGPEWKINMPWQVYNTLSIFIAALLLMWFVHALRRFSKVISLRAAVLSSRLVQVRGLGSYLEYFSGATSAHVNYMIHTRQVEPPTHVRSVHVPFSLQQTKMQRLGNLLSFEIEFWCGVPCRVLLLCHFRADLLKQKATTNSFDAQQHSGDTEAVDDASFYSVVEGKVSASSSASNRVMPVAGGGAALRTPSESAAGSSSSGGGGGASSGGISYTGMKTGVRWLDALRRSEPMRGCPHFLQRVGCCLGTSAMQDVREGAHTLRIQVAAEGVLQAAMQRAKSRKKAAVDEESPAGGAAGYEGEERGGEEGMEGQDKEEPDGSAVVFALLIVPMETRRRGAVPGPPAAAASPPPDDSTVVLDANSLDRNDCGSDVGGGSSVGSGSELLGPLARSPTASSGQSNVSSPSGYEMDMSALEFGVVVLPAPMAVIQQDKPMPDSTAAAAKPLTPSEFIMSANGGTLYSAVEIFGLGSQQAAGFLDAAFVSPHKPRAESSAAPNPSGRGDDECVVCLENMKEILLLPCRHLCICATCLTHIDKCPVCRCQFEEYICVLREPPEEEEKRNSKGGEGPSELDAMVPVSL